MPQEDMNTSKGDQVKIFSEEDSFEPFDEFRDKGYELHLSHPTEEVWQEIVNAVVAIGWGTDADSAFLDFCGFLGEPIAHLCAG